MRFSWPALLRLCCTPFLRRLAGMAGSRVNGGEVLVAVIVSGLDVVDAIGTRLAADVTDAAVTAQDAAPDALPVGREALLTVRGLPAHRPAFSKASGYRFRNSAQCLEQRRVSWSVSTQPHYSFSASSAMFAGRVSRPSAGRSFVKVRAQPFHNGGRDVPRQLHDAAIEVAMDAPADPRRAFALGPIAHKALGAGGVAGRQLAAGGHRGFVGGLGFGIAGRLRLSRLSAGVAVLGLPPIP